jgi:hypothetical protein
MDLDHTLPGGGRRRRDDDDVGFFAYADAVANAEDGVGFEVRVQREVVQAAVGQAVAVIASVFDARD